MESHTMTPELKKHVKEFNEQLNNLWKMEKVHWLQRSRVNWIREGDQNTWFFHVMNIHRRQRHRIVKFQDSRGEWVKNDLQVQQVINDYFHNLHQTENPKDTDRVLQHVSPLVIAKMNNSLNIMVSNDEIKQLPLARVV